MNVLITGWGILSPLGVTREEFAASVRAGRSGIALIERFDTSALASHQAAMIRDPVDYKRHIPAARLRRMDTLSRQLAYVACEAWHHAGLADRPVPPERRAVVVASGMNHTESIEQFYVSLLEEGPEGANPILFPATIPNSAGGLIAIELECRGPNLTITQKETSAEVALTVAAQLLENDEADVVLLAAGELLTPVVFEGLAELQALSRAGCGQIEAMRPFSRRRNGFIAGEGAAAVVLERHNDDAAAPPSALGRLVAAAECCQPCPPIKYPTDPIPMTHAVASLLSTAGRDPRAIAFLSSAANSTRSLDACEAEAITRIAPQLARRDNPLPIAALKALTGELCAGGLTRILAALVALRSGICPPLPFHSDAYDPEFDNLRLSYQDAPITAAGTDCLHLASAAGGHQTVLWLTTEDCGVGCGPVKNQNGAISSAFQEICTG
jgi:3-oxoacyl-[acyl-carrier-protein] synthase II